MRMQYVIAVADKVMFDDECKISNIYLLNDL